MAIWLSPAKLNLFLYITGQRADNYHNLQTLFQFITICDELNFSPRNDHEINLLTSFNNVAPEDNLIIKAAKLLLNYCQLNQINVPTFFGVDITINKKLPMGGGLGGGSSNAATTLVALNQLWQLNLSTNQLMEIGKKLGADVPIFIYGKSAFAQGIGDDLQQANIPEKWYLIVKPDIAIATVSIFKHPELKRDTVTRNLPQLLQTPYTNDCEPIVRKLYPYIDRLITILSSQAPTRLTGTGSCIFSECDTEQQAKTLQTYLHDRLKSSDNTVSFIAKGCNNSPLYH